MSDSWWVRFCPDCGGIDGAYEDGACAEWRWENHIEGRSLYRVFTAPKLSCVCSYEKVEVMTNNTHHEYKTVSNKAEELFIKKNARYGDSWRKMRETSLLDLITAKVDRIQNMYEEISTKFNTDDMHESIDDNLYDIINYCIFVLIKRGHANG